jgi:alpha-tubulin suppressor-like RCC1 family protein
MPHDNAPTNRVRCAISLACVVLLLDACGDNNSTTDSGSDTDTDSDAGADAGEDSGTDTDTGPGDTAIWISAGFAHTCAVIEGGYVKCWGWQQFGQLGYGTDLVDDSDANTSLPSTLPFVRVGEAVSEIEAGGYHTCARLADGDAKCWGYGIYGQLGVDTGDSDSIGKYDVPADHAPIDFGGAAVIQISAAVGNFTCAVLGDGGVRCFGDCAAGETEDHVVDLGGPVAQLCTGADHACAVLESGDVYCWGYGASGALGYGNTDDVWEPLTAGSVDVGGSATQVACGYYHTCALLDTGEIVCWGGNDVGQLGYGNTDKIGDDEVPSSVGTVDVGALVTQISAGNFNTCALLEGGGVKCWGSGGGVPLGYGNTDSVGMTNVPADVGTIDLGGPAVLVDNGYSHMCALLESGDVLCWGNGLDGELGYGLGVDKVGDDETPAEAGDVPLF